MMNQFKSLGIDGAWVFESLVNIDERGIFREWFRSDLLEADLGKKFEVKQSNTSLSSKGVIRGIHFSTDVNKQFKWVTCTNGSVLDYIIDLRPQSPTFKSWITRELNSRDGCSVFITEGLGHAFAALEDKSIVTYLLNTTYSPAYEKTINPLDPELGIRWPFKEPVLSLKDKSAPSFSEFFYMK